LPLPLPLPPPTADGQALPALVPTSPAPDDNNPPQKPKQIGFGVSVTQGYGLLLARRGPSSWSPPLPLKIDGCSLGAVAGYAEQRTLLALASDAEVREFCCCASSGEEGSGKKSSSKKGGGQGRRLKIGLDLTLGLGKRLNQSASVDAKAKAAATGGEQPASAAAPAAPTPATTRAFTLSKGYIVDVSLRGLFVEPDADDLARAYGEGITAEDVLFGGAGGEGGRGDGGELVTAPAEAALLYRALKAAEEGGVAGGVKA
jgi:lipid-binding SYLF domain-containing protein